MLTHAHTHARAAGPLLLAAALALSLPTGIAFGPLAPPLLARTPLLRSAGGWLPVGGRLGGGERQGAAGLCAQIKFADAVEEVLKRKYTGKSKVPRVIKSWRRMDEDYIHKEEVPEFETVQECNSYIEGLKPKAFHDPYEHEWAVKLKENSQVVIEEFKRVAVEQEDSLYAKGNNVWVTAANSTSAASYGPDWKTLALMDRCVWDDTNTQLFPATTKLLRDLEVPCIEAFFARMMPKSKINPHSDYCNFALTSHLGVDIPEGECWISVGNQKREWRNGEMLMFDTSLMHEAANDADRMRFILMLRVWHPELAPSEVDAIKYIFQCLDDPETIERDIVQLAPELLQPVAKPSPSLHFGAQEGGPSPAGGNRAARRKQKVKSKAGGKGGGGFGNS